MKAARTEPIPAAPTRRRGRWRPIAPPGDRARMLGAAADIARAIRRTILEGRDRSRWWGHFDEHSLAWGKPGSALLFAYLGKAMDRPEYLDLARRITRDEAHALAEVPMEPSLLDGFVGVAWMIEHLRRILEVEIDPSPIDEILLEHVSKPEWGGEFDLVSGLAGIGVYAAQRSGAPLARECLGAVVDRLAETARTHDSRSSWFTPPERLLPEARMEFPRGRFDLGMAHGIPAVIALLARCLRLGVRRGTAPPLLEGAVRWLLDHRLPGGAASTFPTHVGAGVETGPARLAWCYGDAGAAAALHAAATATGRPDRLATALRIARRAAARPMETSGVEDACLCHGSAGLALVFQRFFLASGDPVLGDAALRWLRDILARRHPGEGIAGFVDPEWPRGNPGMLGGAVGIALVLLSAATDIEPAWDRLLLTDLTPTAMEE